MLHYNQLLQCSLFTPHMESGLRPLPIYYNVYITIQSTLWGHGSPSLSLHFPLSLSISPSLPLHLPSPLPLCGVDSLPCQLHLLACGGCHHYLLQSCTLQNYVLTNYMQYHLLHLPTMSLSSVSPSYCVLGYYMYCW